MAVYANLKIRNKLILGYAIVVVFCGLIGYFGVNGMKNIKDKLDDMHDNLLPSVALTGMMERHSQQHERSILLLLLATDAQIREAMLVKLKHEEREVAATLEKLGTLPLLTSERALWTEENGLWADYLNTAARVLALAEQGDQPRALEVESLELLPLFTKLEVNTKKMAQFTLERADQYHEQSSAVFRQLRSWMIALALISVLLAFAIALLITQSVVGPIHVMLDAVRSLVERGAEKARITKAIAAGDLEQVVTVSGQLDFELTAVGKDETGVLLKAMVALNDVQIALDQAFGRMTESLRVSRDREALRDWFKTGQNELNTLLRGDKKAEELTDQCLTYLAEYLGAGVGVFYLFSDSDHALHRMAAYALRRDGLPNTIALGEGLAGQAAYERKMICLSQAPADYLPISSALGAAKPCNIVVLPLLHNEQLIGILELGSFTSFSESALEFLRQATEGLAISISVNLARQRVNELLEQTQQQTEELRVQQEELQQSNEELEERAQILGQQRQQILAKNREVEEASNQLQRKADELERVSTYKSEFLANMSHELRTPLNSLMILSGLLKENKDGNLTDKQIQFAATINGAGRDLLNMINDILDLAKIESGRLEFHCEEVALDELLAEVTGQCKPLAEEQSLLFSVTVEPNAPKTVFADQQRLQQILKNLISNACKFTAQGSVSIQIKTLDAGSSPLSAPALAIAVCDTGIGIPADKQEIIFNAFQQADGTTSRKFGGTGLGLSISRQLARSMNGEVILESEPGHGSTFTVCLPLNPDLATKNQPMPAVRKRAAAPFALPAQAQETPETSSTNGELAPAPLPDDRERLQSGGKSILIIEDDLAFAGILLDMVRNRRFQGLVAIDGESGIALAEQYQPSAIILDIMLPHIDGWGVMRSLKDNPATRHIPVHFVTCLEDRQKAMAMGAIGFVSKPVTSDQIDEVFRTIEYSLDKAMRRLLIVEDNPAEAQSLAVLLAERNVEISVASTGSEAIACLAANEIDCVVLDLGLADMAAFELLEHIHTHDPKRRLPVIIHTGQEVSPEAERRLRHYAESIIIKGAKSPERLLNEVTLFLHLVESALPVDKQRMIRTALDSEAELAGKKILVVDDDMRNIFSLSSALTEKAMVVAEAENGKVALAYLQEHPEVDLVLMDIMMPEMDGYEAIRRIRAEPRFSKLPIIALTAKAMKADREECLKVGASDYISKPVDMEKLFSLLRVWLYQAG